MAMLEGLLGHLVETAFFKRSVGLKYGYGILKAI